MSFRSPYAVFVNMVVATRKSRPDHEFKGCEEILAFVSERNALNTTVRITDFIHYIEFGTGPTVHRKCKLLVSKGYVRIDEDYSDRRANRIFITPKGLEYLEKYSQMMKDAFVKADSQLTL